jgi:hypothetical protein
MKWQAESQGMLGESSSTQTGDSLETRGELEAMVRELREALHGC